MANIRINPPVRAAETIRDLAANGASKVGISRHFKVSERRLAQWLEDEKLLQAFNEGRETERHALHNALYRQATEKGNIVAAIFLLKARHGYVEGEQKDAGNRVNITFNLPGAMTPEDYKLAKVVSKSQKVLDADTTA